MESINGANNWKLICRREADGVTILRAGTCDEKAVLPDVLWGLPVTALGDHALTPGNQGAGGEELRILCGPAGLPETWNNETLRDLTLPERLRSAGDYALYNCAGLQTLRLHDGVEFWGGSALMNCRGLNRIFLTRMEKEGDAMAYFAGELTRELDVTVSGPEGVRSRLIFPEYQEIYEENCPAHHFDYSILGAGYPYHHCFRQRRLLPAEYDALWRPFLAMEHDGACALRLAFCRLRWPAGLGVGAADDYRIYLHEHAGAALRMLLEEGNLQDLPFLLRQAEPDRAALTETCEFARRKNRAEAVALLLEELHRRFPAGCGKKFEL